MHFIDESSETSQLLNFFVRNDHSSDSFSKVDQEGRVSDIISSDSTSISANLFDVLFFVGPENRKSQDSIAHHDCSILDEHRVKDSHE